MKKCLHCNKDIIKNKNVYCNKECFYNHLKCITKSNLPDCLVCGKKTNHKIRKTCSRRCALKHRTIVNPAEIHTCYLCFKEVNKHIKICKQCKSHGYHKIYMNYGISNIRKYIKTKKYCEKHLNFYDPEKYCKKCHCIKNIRNKQHCYVCNENIPKKKRLCSACFKKKFKHNFIIEKHPSEEDKIKFKKIYGNCY